MSNRILIIKTGASGDVVRTTCLLKAFENDEITWVTKKLNTELLPKRMKNLKVVAIEDFIPDLSLEYSLVISLDDDLECAQLASSVNSNEILGVYMNGGNIDYHTYDNRWFDMSLISKFGKKKADELKFKNTHSYQELLFSMVGKCFSGEKYRIREDVVSKSKPNLIGLENRAGNRWPLKVWNGYEKLEKQLKKSGFEIFYFKERKTMRDYMVDISKCSLIVTGDTLTMHIAIALEIPTIAIFTCTSFTEIYDYRIVKKIVSPKISKAFYSNQYFPDVLDAIQSEDVFKMAIQLLENPGNPK